MIKRIAQNIKAQNTAEYAILISLAVAGIIAMQKFAQRALQARVHDAGQYLVRETENELGDVVQYEPYYKESSFETTSDGYDSVTSENNTFSTEGLRTGTRTGTESTKYGRKDLKDAFDPDQPEYDDD